MRNVSRYMVQGAVAPVHLADHGLYVLYSDYVEDVNARLGQAAHLVGNAAFEGRSLSAAELSSVAEHIRKLKVVL